MIAPPPPTTPAGVTTWWGSRPLPPDLLRDATRRIGVMSLLGASLWIGGSILYHVAMAQRDPEWWHWRGTDAIALVSGLLSIGLYIYTRSDRRPEFILNLGLAHMVVTGIALGLLVHWDPAGHEREIVPRISWIGAVVLMFAAIVPNSPMKTLVAGAICVTMNPVGMLIARARGMWDFGPTYNVILMHYQDYLLVGVAAVISHVVTSLGREVAKAREMGSYQLGELIGRGGMGEVYKATHRMLARPAAIKLIRPEMAGEQGRDRARVAVTRFRREAMAAANLRSPHTVALYDFGTTEDGTFYFAMELLDGLDLEMMVKQFGPMPAPRVVHILRQVCESLEEAHAGGLVHRDIKPPNIHVGRLGLRFDFVKVLDFGLVKSVTTTDTTQTLATGTGLAPGTPAYMAPEMALGQPVDGRADVYALGCVAYYTLTGRLAFEGADALQMLVKRLQEDPVPPSQRTELIIPPDLERLVLACLARDPNARPDVAQLSRALATLDLAAWTETDASGWWITNQPRASGDRVIGRSDDLKP